MNFFDDHDELYNLSKQASCEAQICYTARQDNNNRYQNQHAINCDINGPNNSFDINFLLFDKDIGNHCNPHNNPKRIPKNIGPSCVGFDCNRKQNVFLVKANNCHTYKNNLRLNAEKTAYCTYHQIFDNITRNPTEKNQYPSGCGVGEPLVPKYILPYDKAPPCVPKCTREHPYV